MYIHGLASRLCTHGRQEDSKEVAALSEQNEEVEMPTLAEGSEVPRCTRDVAEIHRDATPTCGARTRRACGASGRVVLINGCSNRLSRPIRSPGTIFTPNIALIALDPCYSVTIV